MSVSPAPNPAPAAVDAFVQRWQAAGGNERANYQQIASLLKAARFNWRDVEPAIFGTLLERALVPEERHALEAHYTPRAYVERLVLPTVIEPLREDWKNAQAAALALAAEGKIEAARAADRVIAAE